MRTTAKREGAGEAPPRRRPRGEMEDELCRAGYARIAGVDEAGRGPLAGPVVAAAVILPIPCPIEGIDDSKRLTALARERLFAAIQEHARAVAVGIIGVETIDRVNILQATRLAMRRAVLDLALAPDYVVTDAVTIPEMPCPQRPVIHGDRLCLSVAAASIVAKVTRDRILCDLHQRYPEYGFAAHKGYGTREHLLALSRHGVCPEHRRSFAPVRILLEEGRLFDLDAVDPEGPLDE